MIVSMCHLLEGAYLENKEKKKKKRILLCIRKVWCLYTHTHTPTQPNKRFILFLAPRVRLSDRNGVINGRL